MVGFQSLDVCQNRILDQLVYGGRNCLCPLSPLSFAGVLDQDSIRALMENHLIMILLGDLDDPTLQAMDCWNVYKTLEHRLFGQVDSACWLS